MSNEREVVVTPGGDSHECEVEGCTIEEPLARIEPENHHPAKTLCPDHRVQYIREAYKDE